LPLVIVFLGKSITFALSNKRKIGIMKKLLLVVCIGGMLAFVACHREQKGKSTSAPQPISVVTPAQTR
jgi:hypothetical protein